jgi:hypothetical protein
MWWTTLFDVQSISAHLARFANVTVIMNRWPAIALLVLSYTPPHLCIAVHVASIRLAWLLRNTTEHVLFVETRVDVELRNNLYAVL